MDVARSPNRLARAEPVYEGLILFQIIKMCRTSLRSQIQVVADFIKMISGPQLRRADPSRGTQTDQPVIGFSGQVLDNVIRQTQRHTRINRYSQDFYPSSDTGHGKLFRIIVIAEFIVESLGAVAREIIKSSVRDVRLG